MELRTGHRQQARSPAGAYGSRKATAGDELGMFVITSNTSKPRIQVESDVSRKRHSTCSLGHRCARCKPGSFSVEARRRGRCPSTGLRGPSALSMHSFRPLPPFAIESLRRLGTLPPAIEIEASIESLLSVREPVQGVASRDARRSTMACERCAEQRHDRARPLWWRLSAIAPPRGRRGMQ